MKREFDRNVEDLGNAVGLEHVNTTVPDQTLATRFYLGGLGLTRDPYIMVELENMWINVGRSQFHLPASKPQVLRGHTAIVLPDREALLRRLAKAKPHLEGTAFKYREESGYVETVSPWGNVIRCYAPDESRFGKVQLGMPYVELTVPPKTADGIARFYDQVIKAPSSVADEREGRTARVMVGAGQELVFRETDAKIAEYDGHHIQIYLADFSGPYRWLLERGLVTEESDQHQYRFKDIVDVESGKPLFTLEHEIRSMRHPLYARPLVNRNPEQTNRDYVPGYDAAQPMRRD